MPPLEKAALLDKCHVQVHAKPTEILTQGEMPPGFFIIASGVVEISYISAEGHKAIITHLGTAEALGEAEVIACVPCVSSAVAQENAVTLLLPDKDVRQLLQCEIFVRNVSRTYVNRMLRDNQFKAIDQFQPVDQRISSYLSQLSTVDSVVRISQSHLASVAGCSRQTVNRVLGKLRAEGCIAIRKEEIEILDPRALSLHRGADD